jgi:hypothetical protein
MTEQEIYDEWLDEYCNECSWCSGEGLFYGSETPGFDYVNDDLDGIYDCPACMGSGLKKDQRLF